MDLRTLSDEDFSKVKEQVKKYKKMRTSLQNGNFYRLVNPFTSNYCGWQIIDDKKKETFIMYAKIMAQVNRRDRLPKLKGLNPENIYTEERTGLKYSGAQLMYRGIDIIYDGGDFTTKTFHFVAN